MEVKVNIYKNRMVLNAKGKSITITPEAPFTTQRLLVGTFMPALDCLTKGLKEIGALSYFRLKGPVLNIYAREMSEGGLSEVEERCLQELGISAKASKVNVHA